MYYKLNKHNSNDILNIINENYSFPVNSICTSYTDIISIGDFDYVIKDDFTSIYVTDFIEIVEELPILHNWHFGLDIQVILTYEDNLKLLSEVPELAVYVRNNDIPTIIENGYMYIYANFLLEEHREILEQFNAIINERLY